MRWLLRPAGIASVMIVAAIVLALVLYSLYAAWLLFWAFYAWKYKWRAVTRPDSYDGIKVYVARGFGSYSSDRVEVGSMKPKQEDFYERMHECLTVAEERANELNALPRGVR